jgi:hypothetical protein
MNVERSDHFLIFEPSGPAEPLEIEALAKRTHMSPSAPAPPRAAPQSDSLGEVEDGFPRRV